MILPPSTHWIAAMAFERMLYCLAEGSIVAAAVGIALKLAPGRNSRARFAVWLAALAAVLALPVVQAGVASARGMGLAPGASGSSHALLTLSETFVEYIVLAWAAVAGWGLLRVAASVLQIARLRRECVPMKPELLSSELQSLIGQSSRRVSILVSPRLEVPTAIGFFRPAVVVPAWLAGTADSEELKYVLLHELAHLQRWDDWTNLAQKVARAVLFFHPGVWWIEKNLSLEREMACDDAVLAQTGSPLLYARCLAHVAEKSFLRRQIMLAQAAVDRMRQLSLRVARILSADHPGSTRLWKPAMPMVAVIAVLCVVSASNAPNLISVKDNQPPAKGPTQIAARVAPSGGADRPIHPSFKSGAPLVHMAKFTTVEAASLNPARPRKPQSKQSSLLAGGSQAPAKAASPSTAPLSRGGEHQPSQSYGDTAMAMAVPPQDAEAASRRYGVVFVVMTSERISPAGSVTWQVNMWELRLPAPEEHPTKPIPHKT